MSAQARVGSPSGANSAMSSPRWWRASRVAVALLASIGIALAPRATDAGEPKPASAAANAGSAARDVIVQASSLPKGALSEFEFWADPAAAGGRLVGTPNSGGNLDPPPEDDPHVTIKMQVQGGVPYRCWVHLKVGAPKGVSKANKLWLQFTNAADPKGREILKPGTGSYLTAQGPTQQGWAWVPCDAADATAAGSRLSFRKSGEITVRLQAGMEGVGFDQLILSPARFLEHAPTEAVVGR